MKMIMSIIGLMFFFQTQQAQNLSSDLASFEVSLAQLKSLLPAKQFSDEELFTIRESIRDKKSDELKKYLEAGLDINEKITGDVLSDKKPYSLVYWAVLYDNLDFARLLIQKGARIDERYRDDATLLHVASSIGSKEMVNYVLSLPSIELNAQNSKGQTSLHLAIENFIENPESVDIVKSLLKKGADVEIVDKMSNTPLLLAYKIFLKNNFPFQEIKPRALEIIDALLERQTKQSFDMRDFFGSALFHYAVINDDKVMIEKLASKKADASIRSSNNDTPLLIAVGRGNLDIVNYVLSLQDIEINAQNSKGQTPLHLAIENFIENPESVDIVKSLLNKGASLEIVDKEGNTPLLLAYKKYLDIKKENSLQEIKLRASEIINALLAKQTKKSIDELDKSGMALYHYAALYGNKEMIEILASKNANVHIRSKNYKYPGFTPLLIAIAKGHQNLIEYWYNRAKTKNDYAIFFEKDDEGRNANHIGALYSGIFIPSEPLARDYDNKGFTPLMALASRSYEDFTKKDDYNVNFAQKLINVIQEPNQKKEMITWYDKGTANTALHYAAANDNLDLVRWLLQNGADKNQKNKDGKTPSDYAMQEWQMTSSPRFVRNEIINVLR